jgi:transposase-like protein
MSNKTEAPTTLLEAVQYFADEDRAFDFVADLRWADGEQACPHCGSVEAHYFLKTRKKWKCRSCRKQFSIKVGTIFEDSPIKFSKWLPAIWLLANCKNGISSYELARALGVTQKTAWFMLHRIRMAMDSGSFEKLGGQVEVDGTYVGGKAKNMHKAKRERVITGTGGMNKTPVVGLLERPKNGGHSMVRTTVLSEDRGKLLQAAIRNSVEAGSNLYTDGHVSYIGLSKDYMHEVINHAVEYVRGNIHTNGIENFWSLLKRALGGTYVSVEPFHLCRYVVEQTFRFNNRGDTDQGRFMSVLRDVVGQRLTYHELTGAES